jgi:hypothetical protein
MNLKSKVRVNNVRRAPMFCSVTVGRKTFEVELKGKQFILPQGIEATDELFCAVRMAVTVDALKLVKDLHQRRHRGRYLKVGW